VVKEKASEQIQADLLRVLYKLGLIPDDEFNRLIDELQLKLFEREGYVRRDGSFTQPIRK